MERRPEDSGPWVVFIYEKERKNTFTCTTALSYVISFRLLPITGFNRKLRFRQCGQPPTLVAHSWPDMSSNFH